MIERIICGDNLEVLKSIESETVDLVYIDPPFFTQKRYEVVFGDGAEIRQFGDRWITENKNGTGRAKKDINVYLEWMEPRIRELYRVLKKTGSLFLHADWHADAYLRVLCDQIFDRDPTNIITWKRATAKNAATGKFDVTSDTILFYTKSDQYTFIKQYGAEIEKTRHEYQREGDRWFKWGDLTAPGTSSRFEWEGTIPSKNRQWAYTKERLDELKKQGLIRFKNGKVMMRGLKKYVSDIPHQSIGTVWDDINPIVGGQKERIGYPTQKPEALLERIIKASSNEGDIVLDCFCGCGGTIAVAKKLKRQFIGVDISPTAVRLIAKRLKMPIDSIEGLPITPEEIAELDGYEFQNWVIREFGGFSGERGPDGGVDGLLGECPIQVKKFKAGRAQLDAFSGTLLREKKTEGIFIALEFSSDFRAEVARLKRENEVIIHYFDVKDVIDKKHYPIVDKFIPKKGLDKYAEYKTPKFLKEE